MLKSVEPNKRIIDADDLIEIINEKMERQVAYWKAAREDNNEVRKTCAEQAVATFSEVLTIIDSLTNGVEE